MIRALALGGALLIGGCGAASPQLPPGYVVEGSPGTRSLFDSCEAAAPFRADETVTWTSHGAGGTAEMRFVAIGSCSLTPGGRPTRYDVSIDGNSVPTTLEFFAIPETPEDDFVVQSVTPSEDFPFVTYAYLWRAQDGWLIEGPLSYDDLPQRQRRFCVPPTFARPHPAYRFACNFASARNVVRYYREVVHPHVRDEVGNTQ